LSCSTNKALVLIVAQHIHLFAGSYTGRQTAQFNSSVCPLGGEAMPNLWTHK
jgi:hypothetical protein